MGGCAVLPPHISYQSFNSTQLNVPFEAPRDDLCGSTSIHMVSRYWMQQTRFQPALSLKELDERTLLPNRGGTLQVEMISAGRANGLIVYKISPAFEVLIQELSVGHPVIVLVNRSFSWYPLWHYVTITGYDASKKQVISHFGDQPNEAIDLERFLEIWKRSDNWGIVMLPPEHLPASAALKTYLQSVYDMEKSGQEDKAIIGYQSAIQKWPNYVEGYIALGNIYLKLDRLNEAEKTFEKAFELFGDSPLVANNLAIVYAKRGQKNRGLSILDSQHSDDPMIQKMLHSTRYEIMNNRFE